MANKTVTVRSSGGDYTSLSAALSGELAINPNLVTSAMILTIDCAGFLDTTPADVATGWTCNASYYINIVGDNTTGKASSTLYRLSPTDPAVATKALGNSGNVPYVRVKFCEVMCTSTVSNKDNSGISVGATSNMYWTIENNIVHDVYSPGASNTGISYARNSICRNNVVYNIGKYGIQNSGNGTSEQCCNNTIYNYNKNNSTAGRGIAGGIGNTAGCTIANNLVIKGSTDTTSLCYGTLSGTVATNGSSDATGTAGLQSLTTAEFTSITGGSEDLTLASGATSIGAGTDESALYTTDITGTTRSTWDLGAFYYVAAATPQYAYPIADISAGTWTPSTGATLFGVLDETVADDADYISCPSAGAFEVRLTSLSPPQAGTCTLRYRAVSSSNDNLVLSLVEGTTVRQTWTHTALSGTLQLYEQTITDPSAIVDWTNLRLRGTSS